MIRLMLSDSGANYTRWQCVKRRIRVNVVKRAGLRQILFWQQAGTGALLWKVQMFEYTTSTLLLLLPLGISMCAAANSLAPSLNHTFILL